MEIVSDQMVPGSSGMLFTVKKGQHIKIIVVEDNYVIGDFVAFNLHNVQEAFDQARTKANQHRIFLRVGDKLYSKSNSIMFTIVADTFGRHDLQYGMCSKWVYQNILYTQESARKRRPDKSVPQWGCWENLTNAVKQWNIDPMQIPSPFNLYQAMDINEKGEMSFSKKVPKDGDFVELKAEMDVLAALSSCPGLGRPLRVQILS